MIFSVKKRRYYGVQRALQTRNNPFLVRLEVGLIQTYNNILRQKEIFWFQKSRTDWLCFEDKNVAYFHYIIVTKRQRNRIQGLKDSLRQWVSNDVALKTMVVHFCTALFTDDSTTSGMIPIQCQFHPITDEHKFYYP